MTDQNDNNQHVSAKEPGSGGADTPTNIGPYQILDVLGEGGMAVVYLAEQSEPVKRRVALKIVKAGMDSKQVVARFRSEEQALAVLDHPYIAKIFDGGIAESGRPYFAMEHVKGMPITDYCDEHRLNNEQRLELFIQVCSAVQHAHLKGLIHRDLKPSNILVGVVDGTPEPKIIDFGIAKATSTTLTEATLYTRIGQIVGTPQYMSPEQAGLTGLDIDTRADIYSLGVVLYELLVGTVPLDLHAVGEEAMRFALREREPPKPSTRFTELGNTRNEIADARATDPDDIKRQLQGDLDWVVMRAIEKDRTRRYETVNALAMECRRVLRHEAVLARPPSPGYLLGRFVRRNRVVVLSGSLAILAIIGGGAAATIGMFRAIEAERIAVTEAETAREVSTFLIELFGSSDPFASQELSTDISARDLVERGSVRLESELADRPAIQARLLTTLGVVLGNLGDVERSAELVEKAYRIRTEKFPASDSDLADSRYALGKVAYDKGDYQLSIEHFESALALYTATEGSDSAAVADTLEFIASSYSQQGQFQEARAALERSGEIFRQIPTISNGALARNVNALGLTLYMMGDYLGATGAFEDAVRYFEGGEKTGLYARAVANLATTYHLTGQMDRAEPTHREALELKREVFGPRHMEVAYSLSNMGNLFRDLGNYGEAQAMLEDAISVFADALGDDHANVAVVRIGLGHVFQEAGQYEQATANYERSFSVVRDVFGEGSVREIQTLNGMAYLALEQERYEVAEGLFQDTVEKARALDDSHPELGRSYAGLASIPTSTRSPEERELLFNDAIGIIDKTTGENSVPAVDARIRFARHLRANGEVERARGVFKDALDTLEASMGSTRPRYRRYAEELARDFE